MACQKAWFLNVHKADICIFCGMVDFSGRHRNASSSPKECRIQGIDGITHVDIRRVFTKARDKAICFLFQSSVLELSCYLHHWRRRESPLKYRWDHLKRHCQANNFEHGSLAWILQSTHVNFIVQWKKTPRQSISTEFPTKRILELEMALLLRNENDHPRFESCTTW